MVYRLLSKELQEVAVKKLYEDPNKVEENIKLIREWAESQSHLKIRTDDQWLLSFLRGCRFKLDLVKQKLEALYTVKSHTPEWFSNRDPFLPEIQELLKLGMYLPLPNTSDPAAPRVVLFRECVEALNYPLEVRVKLAFMMMEIMIYEDDNYVISGYQLIADGKNTSFQHIYQMQLNVIRKLYKFIAEGFAVRPKGFHGLNVPWIAEVAYNTFKYIAHQKIVDMVRIYTEDNIEELYETVPLSILPEEYGGSGGSIQEITDAWKAKIESYRDWFMEDEPRFEEKPEEKPDDADDLFGLGGLIC